jgi:hypothetical protein
MYSEVILGDVREEGSLMKIITITLALLLLFILGCASSPSISNSKYDINAAMQEAGKYAEDGKTKFFMFHIPASSPIESTSVTLQQHLSEATKSNATIAIIGADHSLNFSILNIALTESGEASLTGANLIYVGDENHFEELENLALSSGATFKATTYPEK